MKRAVSLCALAILGVALAALARPASAQLGKKPPDLDPEHAAKMANGLELFKKQVKPILEAQCRRCHGGKAVEAELDLSDRESLLKGGQHGPAIVVGKSRDSLLFKHISHQREPHMPKDGPKLADAAIAQIAS